MNGRICAVTSRALFRHIAINLAEYMTAETGAAFVSTQHWLGGRCRSMTRPAYIVTAECRDCLVSLGLVAENTVLSNTGCTTHPALRINVFHMRKTDQAGWTTWERSNLKVRIDVAREADWTRNFCTFECLLMTIFTNGMIGLFGKSQLVSRGRVVRGYMTVDAINTEIIDMESMKRLGARLGVHFKNKNGKHQTKPERPAEQPQGTGNSACVAHALKVLSYALSSRFAALIVVKVHRHPKRMNQINGRIILAIVRVHPVLKSKVNIIGHAQP